MRKKLIYGLLAGSVLAAMLTGCGDGSEESGAGTSSEVAVISPEPALSDTEREILDYELKYNTGEFTMEDYQALAGLYGEAGLIRRQRDMLEESYRLYEDAQAFETLQGLAVNLDEEEQIDIYVPTEGDDDVVVNYVDEGKKRRSNEARDNI